MRDAKGRPEGAGLAAGETERQRTPQQPDPERSEGTRPKVNPPNLVDTESSGWGWLKIRSFAGRMAVVERTLGLIKPDAIEAGLAGRILADIEAAGFRIVALKMLRLSPRQAEAFYSVHKDRPFFRSLIAFMTSGPVIAYVLERENAVEAYRQLMGATDPAKAEPGTLRARYAQNIERNAVHGSDSVSSAQREIAFFFPELELVSLTTEAVPV